MNDSQNFLISVQGLSSSSLKIAFNAKRYLQGHAPSSLSLPNLEVSLYFLGISRHDVNALFQREHIK